MTAARPSRRLRPRDERPSLADVAAHARVSTATVSRVLNASGPVSDDLRERVGASVEALRYMPNAAARTLASRRSHTVGVIVPTIANSIFSPGVEAMQARAAREGVSVLIATSNYDIEREFAELRMLVARGVDGLVLVGRWHHPDVPDFCAEHRVPYVCQGAYEVNGRHPMVGFDNAKAMHAVTRHLLDLGHRRIALLSGVSRHNDRVFDRRAGVATALAQAGFSLPDDHIVECRYDVAEARDAMRHMLHLDPRPTAVLCMNDVLASGALFECLAQGVAVPREMSIVGFDDFAFSAHLHPALSTIRVPTDRMGEAAIEHLLARIAGRPVEHAIEIPVEFISRDSVAPPLREAA